MRPSLDQQDYKADDVQTDAERRRSCCEEIARTRPNDCCRHGQRSLPSWYDHYPRSVSRSSDKSRSADVDTRADYVDPFSMECRTDADFTAFSTALSKLIVTKHGKHPLYAKFMLQFARDACAPLRDVDTRKTASALTTLANEKQTAAKDAMSGSKKKSKGAAKPGLAKVGCRADVGTYEEALDDSGEYDDFVSTLFKLSVFAADSVG